MEERDQLDLDLDRIVDGRPVSLLSPHAPLVVAATKLRDALAEPLDPAVAEAHLARLASARMRPRSALLRRGATIALAAALALTLVSGAAFAASASAAPGDTFFGVRRGFERAALAMRTNTEAKAGFALRIAAARLADLRRSPDDGLALRAYGDALSEAAAYVGRAALGLEDQAVLDHVQAQLENHLSVLQGLLDAVPAQAQEGIQNAIDNASKAQEQVRQGGPDDRDEQKPGRGRGDPRRPAAPGRR